MIYRIKNILGLSILVTTFIFNSACAHSVVSSSGASSGKVLSVREFYQNRRSYDGKRVIVRGYLLATGPGLIMSEDRQGAPNRGDPIILIYDSTPDRALGNEGFTEDIHCTDVYVELVGIGGYLEAYGYYGIRQIESIRIFEGSNFVGDGGLCYESHGA